MKRIGMQFFAGVFSLLTYSFCQLLFADNSLELDVREDFSTQVASETKLPLVREKQLMSVHASFIPQAIGESIPSLRLFAVRNAQLEAIPFQVREFSQEGLPYFDSINVPSDGVLNVLDKQDELLFMLSDAGERWQALTSSMPILTELLIKTEVGARYVYLTRASTSEDVTAKQPPLVTYDVDTGWLKGLTYAFKLEENDVSIWHNIQALHDETFNKSHQASKKIRSEEAGFNAMRLALQLSEGQEVIPNQQVKAKLIDVQEGPLSTLLLLRVNLMTASYPVMKFLICLEALPQQVNLHTRAKVSEMLGSFLVNPSLQVGLVEFDQKKQVLLKESFTDLNPGKILKYPLDTKDNWRWMRVRSSMDFLSKVEVSDQTKNRFEGLAFNKDGAMQLDRDKISEVEALTMLYRFTQLKPGNVIKFTANIAMHRAFGKNLMDEYEPGRIANQMLHQPSVINLGSEVVSFYNLSSDSQLSSIL